MAVDKKLALSLADKEKSVIDTLKKKAPTLHWAKMYHINTHGDKLKFSDSPYLNAIYANFHKWHFLCGMKSVQTRFSELFIASHFYEAAELGFTVFYVLPKYDLRNRFVSNRIDKTIRRVPHYSSLIKEAGGAARVSLKHFGKGTIVYVGSNVEDEFLEIPVDSVYIDEKDRCNQDNLLLVPDRLTASPYKYMREISNPTIEGFGIDERYQQSTKGRWFIPCEHCGHSFTLDFFSHVVRQKSPTEWEALDPNYKYKSKSKTDAHVYCPKCSKPVNRLSKGEWIDEYPDREWKGLQISALFNSFVSVKSIIDKWQDSCNHPKKMQVFYNSVLGLPFTSKGAKIDDTILNACQRRYQYPINQKDIRGVIEMGVDVNVNLNVIIRERVKNEHNIWVRRLVLATTIPSFTLLRKLLAQWKPRICVIDAQPEIHEVAELKSDFDCVYSSRFAHNQLTFNVNKDSRIVTQDRTSIMDGVKSEFEQELLEIPVGADHIEDGAYYSQLKSSTRILLVNETNIEKSYYSYEHSMPDHYNLAEAYCLQADLLIPRETPMDFYKKFTMQSNNVQLEKEEIEEIKRQTGLKEDQVKKLINRSPYEFLQNLQKKKV